MNEIVYRSQKGTPVTNSLLVSEKFEKNHKDVLKAIRSVINSAQNCAQYFYATKYKDTSGKSNDMFIMNRDGFSLLAMGFTGEKALQFKIGYIEQFNRMETELKAQAAHAIPQSFAEALRLAANQQMEIEAMNKQLAIQAPKAELADRLIDTDTGIDIGQAAKLLKLPYGRNTFFENLRSKGVFFKTRNEPKQEYIERGYFKLYMKLIERKNHPDLSVFKIIVTQKGLSWLAKMFETTVNSPLPKLSMI